MKNKSKLQVDEWINTINELMKYINDGSDSNKESENNKSFRRV